jgi:hypothetical protein
MLIRGGPSALPEEALAAGAVARPPNQAAASPIIAAMTVAQPWSILRRFPVFLASGAADTLTIIAFC